MREANSNINQFTHDMARKRIFHPIKLKTLLHTAFSCCIFAAVFCIVGGEDYSLLPVLLRFTDLLQYLMSMNLKSSLFLAVVTLLLTCDTTHDQLKEK
jgi:Flp pilus assembly protein protease CpaA